MMSAQPEVWLRGPVPGIDPLLQPAAHALLQAREDVERALGGLSREQIWLAPDGAASVGFHVVHMVGSTDRLLTYARGEILSEVQRRRLDAERNPEPVDAASLIRDLRAGVDAAMAQLASTSADALHQARTVGREALPTTVLGLLFHAAEHAQRHAGQVVTTAKLLRLQISGERGHT
jgi:uncharacterized damage-inducible protein DinB